MVTGLSMLLIYISLALVLFVNPIVMACRLNLKMKWVIVGLSVANIFTLGLTGLIAQILMIINMKNENYFNYSEENYYKSVRQSEKGRYIVHVILYVLELVALLLPVVNVDGTMVKISLNTLKDSYNMFEFIEASSSSSEAALYLYALVGSIAIGVLINFIVRDPRKTMFFDGIMQIVYLAAVAAFSYGIDNENYISGAIGLVIATLVVAAFMFEIFVFEVLSVYPESFNKKEAKNE